MANTDNKTAKEYFEKRSKEINPDFTRPDYSNNIYSELFSLMNGFANQQNASLINDLKELREKIEKINHEHMHGNFIGGFNFVKKYSKKLIDELLTKHQE